MSVKITYFVHGTTTDNQAHISSGWSDVELSELGFRRTDAFSEGDSWAHKWDMGPVVAYFFKKNLHGLLHISRFGNRERSLGLEISLVF